MQPIQESLDWATFSSPLLVGFAVNCILMWAVCKETCPQCKAPFNYLITYRQLDGTITDYPTEESVCLLKRARWFEDYVKVSQGEVLQQRCSAAKLF